MIGVVSPELDARVEPLPSRCSACGAQWGAGKVLVGWDNLHSPSCRSWTCRACDRTAYAPDWQVWQLWKELVADASRS